jgi:ATP-dependent Lon protease
MILTGSQGDVMKESIQCAKTIAWNILPKSIKSKIKKDWDDNGSWGLHIHTPDTATPKDGPSAGGAITLGIVSRLTGVPIKNTIATTGEIDLNGNIKKIGGLISKILGGYKAGIKTVIIPKENEHDYELIKKEGLMPKALKVILIDHVKELLDKGLVGNDLEFNYDNI